MEYDDGLPETSSAGGVDAPTDQSEIHDESDGGGQGTENEQPHGDGPQSTETDRPS